jgi:hypothetical protein
MDIKRALIAFSVGVAVGFLIHWANSSRYVIFRGSDASVFRMDKITGKTWWTSPSVNPKWQEVLEP